LVIWLTGPSGAGKSALANELRESIDAVVLDGDAMRASISLGAGFSREDRAEHNLRVARLARVLSERHSVIVSVIAPMRDIREKINAICKPFWVYVKRDVCELPGHFYEEPIDYFITNHNKLDLKKSARRVLGALGYIKPSYSAFIGRFQPLHQGHVDLINSVLDEGKYVLVMLRDTRVSPTNPYTIAERRAMFNRVYGNLVRVIAIPDIDEVCHGRDVGWRVREIRLGAEVESISATEIRKEEDDDWIVEVVME